MRRQGPSEGDEGGRKSRVQERDVGEEGLYLCEGRSGAVRGRESDGAPYPIGRAAKPGGCDSEFCITEADSNLKYYVHYQQRLYVKPND